MLDQRQRCADVDQTLDQRHVSAGLWRYPAGYDAT